MHKRERFLKTGFKAFHQKKNAPPPWEGVFTAEPVLSTFRKTPPAYAQHRGGWEYATLNRRRNGKRERAHKGGYNS